MKTWLKVLVIIFIAASSLMPFSFKRVKAESVSGDSPIIGVNITQIDREYGARPYQGTVTLTTDMIRWQCVSGTSTKCNVWQSQNTSDVVQDDITGTITYSQSTWDVALYEYDFVLDDDYVGSVLFNNTTVGATTVQRYYVNGSHLILTSTQLITSFSISDYSLIRKSSDNFMWMFPIESFNIINQQFESNYTVTKYLNNAQYIFPIFSVSNGNRIARIWSNAVGREYYFIFGMNVNLRMPNYADVIKFTNCEVTNIEELYYSSSMIIKKFYLTSTAAGVWVDAQVLSNQYYMPIYLADTSAQNKASTDFALNYGLTNPVMANIEKIANGTTGSNESASDLEDNNDQMASDMNDMATVENQYNQDFNNQLDNIDFTNPVQQNAGILPAATFVISIFNGLINNNPLSMLIIVCCILLIGKKVIGK